MKTPKWQAKKEGGFEMEWKEISSLMMMPSNVGQAL